jgi:hypothetical protein
VVCVFFHEYSHFVFAYGSVERFDVLALDEDVFDVASARQFVAKFLKLTHCCLSLSELE